MAPEEIRPRPRPRSEIKNRGVFGLAICSVLVAAVHYCTDMMLVETCHTSSHSGCVPAARVLQYNASLV